MKDKKLDKEKVKLFRENKVGILYDSQVDKYGNLKYLRELCDEDDLCGICDLYNYDAISVTSMSKLDIEYKVIDWFFESDMGDIEKIIKDKEIDKEKVNLFLKGNVGLCYKSQEDKYGNLKYLRIICNTDLSGNKDFYFYIDGRLTTSSQPMLNVDYKKIGWFFESDMEDKIEENNFDSDMNEVEVTGTINEHIEYLKISIEEMYYNNCNIIGNINRIDDSHKSDGAIDLYKHQVIDFDSLTLKEKLVLLSESIHVIKSQTQDIDFKIKQIVN